MYVNVKELNREQIIQLKESYLLNLDDEGILNEVLYDNADWDADGRHNVSTDELVNADSLITDEMVFEHYKGIQFTEEDFY